MTCKVTDTLRMCSMCQIGRTLGLLLLSVIAAVGQEADDFRLFPPSQCKGVNLPPRMTEWQENVQDSAITVELAYGNGTCSSSNDCFGTDLQDDPPLELQLMPVSMQPGVQLRFLASPNMDVEFAIQPYKVTEEGFRNCDFTTGQSVVKKPTTDVIKVPDQFLQPGVNYFITNTSDTLFDCRFGLRLNVTVKTERCAGPGGDPGLCWNNGRCVTTPQDSHFHCDCCKGYTGEHCSDDDGCADGPCLHGGTCLDMKGTQSTQKFACTCPQGWHGALCEIEVENLCTHNPCDNNATCVGTKAVYECMCPHGYTGHHCEVNLNDCEIGPCQHGVCVDKVGGYQCYCTPGWGGHNCDKRYSMCRTNSPCLNGGFCIDKDGDYECHCERGYTGPHCASKVNLCQSSPCYNATDCVDFGKDFYCVCNPGFTGSHCEIDINECDSNPCKNNGKCHDEISGYTCLCPLGTTGRHCEHAPNTLPGQSSEQTRYDSGFHTSHTQNLYIVAGTLAGALILALAVLAGCYCRVHETYRVFFRHRTTKPGGYVRQKDDSANMRPETSTAASLSSHSPTPRPAPDAIMEASRHGYHDDINFRDDNIGFRDNHGYRENMEAPLVSSLKPKRI